MLLQRINGKKQAPGNAITEGLFARDANAGRGLFKSTLGNPFSSFRQNKSCTPFQECSLVRPGGFEPLAFRGEELRQGCAD